MPFVIEDLWQRIPRRFEVESIMFTPYPLANEAWIEYDSTFTQVARHIKSIFGFKGKLDSLIAVNLSGLEEASLTIVIFAGIETFYSVKNINENIQVRICLKDIANPEEIKKNKANHEKKKQGFLKQIENIEVRQKKQDDKTTNES